MGMILVNGLSGQIMNRTKVEDLIPVLSGTFLANRDIAWFMALCSTTLATISACYTFSVVFRKIGPIRFVFYALPGLLPLWQWAMGIIWVFGSSEWAWRHPMLAIAILTPSYSMINSKMIVCTVTNMQPVMEYTTFMMFMLF